MTTTEKIQKAIWNTPHDETPYDEGVYEYKGLIEDVENALIEDGFDPNKRVPTNVINDLVYQLI